MNRLRVRVELNRRKAGVPLDEMVSVVDETRKFFSLLAEDVEIDPAHGEWLASDFDPESLNFTAEYNGPVSPEQVHAFNSAFSGSTSLRRETIAQFTHIAEYLGEDELVGFGLYQTDEEAEPSDWRCLSRRDALRFGDEIQLLAQAAGESVSPLPAVMNGSAGGRRLFKGRREREALTADPSKWIREVESSLSRRLALLEGELEAQNRKLQTIGAASEAAETRFVQLLGAMDSFWTQAPKQLAAPQLEQISSEESLTTAPVYSAPLSKTPADSHAGWVFVFVFVAAIAAGIGAMESRSHQVPSSAPHETAPIPTAKADIPKIVPANDVDASIGATPVKSNEKNPAEVSGQKTPSSKPQAVAVAREIAPAQMIHEIMLQVPADLKSTIVSEALVNVNVTVDETGRVMNAKAISTKGDGADLLVPEALRVARRFRFRPARDGRKAIQSQAALTFTFEPESNEASPEVQPNGTN